VRRIWILVALAAAAVVAAVVAVVLVLTGASAPRWREPHGVGDLAARVDRAVRGRMEDGNVPQAAVAIVHDGRVAWARTYGGATARSRFQVGSVSKPAAAVGLLRIARQRGTDLDAPLPLRGWNAPDGITLRRLLSHTAGLSVPGYVGLDPSRPLPSTLEEIDGRGEAPAVGAVDDAGSSLRYSGGGYTVAQLWAEQAAGRPFAQLMDETVLQPLGMTQSTFAQAAPPPGALGGHDAAGRAVPSYRYAALAAAGMWSTAPDIGRLLAFALSEDPTARAMRAAQPATGGTWGMGLERRTLEDGRTVVEHEGVNRGWHARIVGDPRSGWGLVVLTDSDAGGDLIDAAIAELIEP
jgi:CubicO group peptidase (beta-lactamase class C family)